jgi:hypothetical protein
MTGHFIRKKVRQELYVSGGFNKSAAFSLAWWDGWEFCLVQQDGRVLHQPRGLWEISRG